MEKLARKLADKISLELSYSEEKKEVIAYGLIALIQTIIFTLLVAVIGFLIGTAYEALIICFSTSLLRKYSGGAHVSSPEACTVIGVLTCILLSLICTYLLAPLVSNVILSVLSLSAYFLSAFLIYKLAPVDSPNKPIRSEKKIKRMRKGSFTVLAVYFIISTILFLCNPEQNTLISISVALLLGVLWQTFTLTKLGAATLKIADLTFKKIFRLREEVNL